jgi:hypothetical protein
MVFEVQNKNLFFLILIPFSNNYDKHFLKVQDQDVYERQLLLHLLDKLNLLSMFLS